MSDHIQIDYSGDWEMQPNNPKVNNDDEAEETDTY